MFSRAETAIVKCYESLYRVFWNRKVEQLSHSPSLKNWSKAAISGVVAKEWTLKKTTLLFNHVQHLMCQDGRQNKMGKQKADTVHQGTISMLNAHKSLLRLDEKLWHLKDLSDTTWDKKRKIKALKDEMQAQLTGVKKMPFGKVWRTWPHKRK